jgi:lysophospholipase L1-like esterase
VLLGIMELASSVILDKLYTRNFSESIIQQNKYGNTDGLKANMADIIWGKFFGTDERGFRKQRKKANAKKAVLYIGDSVTQGVGVADSCTFSNLLNESNDSVQVYNCSMIGWSVSDYSNVVDVLAKDSSLHISTINLCWCLNDIYGKTPVAKLPKMERFGLISKISSWLQEHYSTYKLVKLFATRNSDNYFRYDAALYQDREAYDKAMDEIKHIKEKCDSAGIELNFVLLPYRSATKGNKNNDNYEAIAGKLKESLKANKIDSFIDVSGAKTDNDYYLFSDEIHLSEKGHRAVADYLRSK